MASVAPSPSAEASGPAAAGIPLDTVVATTVEWLSVRHSPGSGSERAGFLALGTDALVLDGPTVADGMPWYLISGMGLPYASGCAVSPPDQPISCSAFLGWVAGANAVGDPWLAPADPGDCPEPTMESISEMGFTWRLVCWADEPITFDAWWPGATEAVDDFCAPPEAPAAFLFCQERNPNGLAATPEEGVIGRLSLSIDPASGVTMPEPGQWIRVTGRFDHEAAAACADLVVGDTPRDPVVVYCRVQFVPSEVEPLGT